MPYVIDYSPLDQPDILGSVFYPRRYWAAPLAGASDHLAPVDDGISIGCRWHPAGMREPSILLFHGNGEVVYDYDDIAPLYNRAGINLFVADYRGYGQSGGTPSFSSAVADSHVILDYFLEMLQAKGYSGPLFVMGRSLGSLSAAELAANRPEHLRGLIIESGFASTSRFLRFLPSAFRSIDLEGFEKANLEKLGTITMPVLLLHGEYDEIIPHEQARIFFEKVGSEDKKLITIPGAGHNDILLIAMREYIAAIQKFVLGHQG
jgi:alpha-beta hydrolase superfamily lysophospholipase